MKVNGKEDIPYMKWKIKHVWNHQPDIIIPLIVHVRMYALLFMFHLYTIKTPFKSQNIG